MHLKKILLNLLRHRTVTAHKLVEHDCVHPNDEGWLVHHYWNDHVYQVIYSWRLYIKHRDGFSCTCADRRITGTECADIRAVKIYIERHKEISV